MSKLAWSIAALCLLTLWSEAIGGSRGGEGHARAVGTRVGAAEVA